MSFLYELDKSLLLKINQEWTSSGADIFFPAITDLHKNPWFFGAIATTLLILFVWKYRKVGLVFFVVLLLALGSTDLIGNHIFKKNVARARPGDEPSAMVIVRSPYGGYSFTSNHAANMFCLAKYTSEFIPQVRLITYSAALLISYSRIYNGVHYPSDVLGGGIMGWIVGWIYSILGKNIYNRLRKRVVS
ncbi:MAG TPA: phosphatase PAP2 family protein [Pseudobdellovibrionaceae bacterium]|jgi:undecaprenyl-diphosphatase